MPSIGRTGALLGYAGACLAVAVGVGMAIRAFPEDFDWVYTVISHLASFRRNPEGAPWIAGSLLVALALVWPATGYLRRTLASGGIPARLGIVALRLGMLGALVLGLEGFFALDLSPLGRKAHEAVAIVAFLGFYVGVLGLELHGILRRGTSPWAALVVALPLVAVGLSQLALYFDQRDLGWVGTDWREMGIPFYLSLALWQWLAVLGLAAGLGHLLVTAGAEGEGTSGPDGVRPRAPARDPGAPAGDVGGGS